MPFPFEDGTGSTVIADLVGGPAAALTAVALVVAPGARASGWGARAAIELAARWRGPRRLLLADLDLERPVLHEMLGAPNDEGVIDLIDYGISVGRLIRSAADGAYDFLPAGLFTPDPGALLRHEGWDRVLLEVAARRGTLLAWVPADADGVEAVVERAGAVLVLAEPGEGRELVERLPHPYAVLGILTPAPVAEPAIETPAADVADDSADDVAVLDSDELESTFDTAAVEPASGASVEEASVSGDAEESVADPRADEDPIAARRAEDSVEPVETADAEDALGAESAGVHAEDMGVDPAVGADPDDAGDALVASTDEDDLRVHAAVSDAGLEDDPEAREALARAVRERQRDARLAGAAPAAGAVAAAGLGAAAAAESEDQHSLDDEAEDIAATEPDPGIETLAILTPDSADGADIALDAGADPVSADADAVAELDASADAPVTVDGEPVTGDSALPEYSVAARPTAPPPADARRGPAAGHRSPPPRRTRSRYRHPLVWTVGVVLLMSLLAGAWHFLSNRLAPVEAPLPEAAAPEPPAPAAPAEQNALPFVVAIEAHRELLVAQNRVADLSEIEPELLFHVEPLEREGTLFYHVMAGPVPDSAAALALRDTLIARGHKTGVTPTDVRATPLAFLIGDYATRGGADEQQEILRRLEIPGYVLEGEAADGAALYRLYVGGFASEAEADVTRQLLRSAGIRDSLVTRTGRIAGTELIAPEGDSAAAGDSLATPTGSSNP